MIVHNCCPVLSALIQSFFFSFLFLEVEGLGCSVMVSVFLIGWIPHKQNSQFF